MEELDPEVNSRFNGRERGNIHTEATMGIMYTRKPVAIYSNWCSIRSR